MLENTLVIIEKHMEIQEYNKFVSTCCKGIHELFEWKSVASSNMVLDSNIRFSVNKKRMNVHVVWLE